MPIDEGQPLSAQLSWLGQLGSVEWARQLSGEGCFALAVYGDLKLLEALKTAPQLQRRTHPGVILSNIFQSDVEAFCRARGFADQTELASLCRIAKRHGGTGDVAKMLSTASPMGKNQVPTLNDVRVAIEYLGFKAGAH